MNDLISIYKVMGILESMKSMHQIVDRMILEHETGAKVYDLNYLIGQKQGIEQCIKAMGILCNKVENDVC